MSIAIYPNGACFTSEFFRFGDDTLPPPRGSVMGNTCFVRGTQILTPSGVKRPVESLSIGEDVVTYQGRARPIRWIGHRSYAHRFAAGNSDIQPIHIRPQALGDGLPVRDLFVSPQHAVLIDGALIHAGLLVNGHTITQAEMAGDIDYFHIELDSHDVILAEGVPCETFVDEGSRMLFHNGAARDALDGGRPRPEHAYYAPLVEDGETLARVRAALTRRYEPGPSAAPASAWRGHLDLVARDRIEGWAFEEQAAHRPVLLRVSDNGVVICEVTADQYRADLEDSGIGEGRHSFSLQIPGGLAPEQDHLIDVVRVADGGSIGNAPWLLKATAPKPELALPSQATRAVGLTKARGRAGVFDGVADRGRLTGWCWAPARADEALALQIVVDGAVVGRVLANRPRDDLIKAGIGDGRHGFEFLLPVSLSPVAGHSVEVRYESDGAQLDNSPQTLEATTSFDPALEDTLAQAIDALAEADRERVLTLLLAHADRLRQTKADADGGREQRLRHLRARRGGAAQSGPGLRAPGLRALVIGDRIPVEQHGESQAVLSHMRALMQLGYAVSFAPSAQQEPGTDRFAALQAEGIALCGAPFYVSVEDVLRRQASCFDLIYLHAMTNAARYMTLARTHHPQAQMVYAVGDLVHLKLAEQAQVEGRPELLAESQRARLAECSAAWAADIVLTGSEHEASVLRAAVPTAAVHLVAQGLSAAPSPIAFADRQGIAFFGQYDRAEDRDAARFLATEVMPLVWAREPGLECMLVGSAIPPEIRKLARPGLLAVGQVEAPAVLEQVRLTVAPLRIGAGCPDKILSSFAAGVPCVMTSGAARGIELPERMREAMADDAAGLAAAILRLHENEADNTGVALAGIGLIGQNCSEDRLIAALGEAIGAGGLPRPIAQAS